MVKDKIIKAIKKVTGMEEVYLEVPEREEFGDYSTNIAMQVFASSKNKVQSAQEKPEDHNPLFTIHKSPHEVAEEVVERLQTDNNLMRYIEKIEVAGPGFINFYLKTDVFLENLNEIIRKGDKFGKSEDKIGKKIVIEYTDPNPFKELHIGHLYSNAVGETLARLQEALGATVWRADYFGDVGMHVAKSIWGLKKKLAEDYITLGDLESKSLNERIHYLGQAYSVGASAYKENHNAQEEMKDLNYIIFSVAQEFLKEQRGWDPIVDFKRYIEDSNYDISEISEMYRKGRTWSLEYFETIYKRLGTKFDGYYPESIVGEYGYKLVNEHIGDVFEKGDKGAIIFPGEKYGLHNRVFINSLGLPTYEAKELGLAPAKYEDFKYDQSIIVTGNEINEYFNVLLKALQLIDPRLGNITVHIGHGMVKLPEGKMSSRTGKILRGEWLIEEAKKKIEPIVAKSENVPDEEKTTITEIVGIGAVKYALLKSGIGNDLIFNFKESINFEGNSGPYLQYTYARTQSVLKKALDTSQLGYRETQKLMPSAYRLVPEEMSVLRALYQYSGVIENAAKSYSPNLLCNYLYELAQKYNTFYNKHRILEENTERLKDEKTEKQKHQGLNLLITSYQSRTTNFRLALTAATGQVLKNGLDLLGIQAPDRM